MAGEVRISVRNLVEFILRSGDIDDRRQGSPENAMQEGSRIHRMIQRRMGAEYQAEVALKYTHPTDGRTVSLNRTERPPSTRSREPTEIWRS